MDDWISEFQIWWAGYMSKYITPSSDISVGVHMLKFLLASHWPGIELLPHSGCLLLACSAVCCIAVPWVSEALLLTPHPRICGPLSSAGLPWIMTQCFPSWLHFVILQTMAGLLCPFPWLAFTSDTSLIHQYFVLTIFSSFSAVLISISMWYVT